MKENKEKMEEKPRSNDDVYDDWKTFIKKRNKFYGNPISD